MAKVYILTSGPYYELEILGVFRNRADADAAASRGQYLSVVEKELDGAIDWTWGDRFAVNMCDDGFYTDDQLDPGLRHPTEAEVIRGEPIPEMFRVISPISCEHAVAVANEKRRDWLPGS